MPFFERLRNLKLSLNAYADVYGAESGLEINVVDDGSIKEPCRPAIREYRERTGMNIRDEYLGPPKNHILCPVVPYNLVVAMASRDYVVITGPEMLHTRPVLGEMLEAAKREGESAVVCPAVWNDFREEWICHGVHARNGYQFCMMLHRRLFGKAGGLDLDYRFGHCVDDNDWVQRLLAAGGRYVYLNKCVVVHHGEPGDERVYDPEKRAANCKLFAEKWPNPKPI